MAGRCCQGLVSGCLVLAVVAPAWAQTATEASASSDSTASTSTPSPSTPERTEDASSQAPTGVRALQSRVSNAIEALNRRGVFLAGGSVGSGSGMAGGAVLRDDHFGRSSFGGEIGGVWSVRGFTEYSGRLGVIDESRDTLRIGAADANLTSLFTDHSDLKPGWAAYVQVTDQTLPRVGYFGLSDLRTSTTTDYALDSRAFDLVGQWQITNWMGVSARAGISTFDVGPGTDDARPNVQERHTPETAPGLTERPRLATFGVAVALDRRDSPQLPTAGWLAGVSIWRFTPINGGNATFNRVTFDGRAFVPLWSDRNVVAVRFLMGVDDSSASTPTPFYLQYWLGGSHTLRGYSSFQFRGEALAHLSVEHRWRVLKFADLVLFADAGSAADAVHHIWDSPIHVTPGLGVWIRRDDRFLIRVDWAHSPHGHRILWSLSPSF